jgi:hypothetical protein
MKTKAPYSIARWFLTASILLLPLAGAYGQSGGKQGEVKIKNTAKQIKPGLYECIIYLDMSSDLLRTIDDVTYTLPSGYPNRKQKGKKFRPGVSGFFSSSPIITAEEAVVNVKIDYKGPNDVYLSYKLKLFKAALK